MLVHRIVRNALKLVLLIWMIALLHRRLERGVRRELARSIVLLIMMALCGIVWHAILLVSAEVLRICAYYRLHLAHLIVRRAGVGARMLHVLVVLRGVHCRQIVQVDVAKLEQIAQVVETGVQRQ